MKCVDCIFCSVYRDMGASCNVCSLEKNLSKAVRRFERMKDVGCPMRVTMDAVLKMQRNLCDVKWWGNR